MKFSEYVTEAHGKKVGAKPKKGDWYKDIRGDEFQIATVSGQTVYLTVPGSTRRDVVFVKYLTPDETGMFWVER